MDALPTIRMRGNEAVRIAGPVIGVNPDATPASRAGRGKGRSAMPPAVADRCYFKAAPPRARYWADRRANWPPSVLIEVWTLPPALKTIAKAWVSPYSCALRSM